MGQGRGKVEMVGGGRIVRGAIVDITKLKSTESQLFDTIKKLQLAASAGSVGLWTRHIGSEIIWASEEASQMWGFTPPEQFTQADFVQHVHPDDRAQFEVLFRDLNSGRKDYQLEYRILAEDGNVRWIHSKGIVDETVEPRVIRGAVVDITKLKLAEASIRDLSHRLVNAQEKERARLALELHDDLNQNVALLAIEMGLLLNDPKDMDYVKSELERIIERLQRLAKDVHRISHELHPSTLERLGLKIALTGFCRDLAAAHDLKIDVTANGVPRDLCPDISLCIYRIAQESLKNVVKHSNAALAHVSLTFEPDEIRLEVSDNGNGFDTAMVREKGGLGLVSIDERVSHVNGKAQVTSGVGEGTKVEVSVPITDWPDTAGLGLSG